MKEDINRTRANRGLADQLHIASRGIPLYRGFAQRGTVDTEMSDRAGQMGEVTDDEYYDRKPCSRRTPS